MRLRTPGKLITSPNCLNAKDKCTSRFWAAQQLAENNLGVDEEAKGFLG